MSRSRARKHRRNPMYKFYRILEAGLRRAKSFEELVDAPFPGQPKPYVTDLDVTFLYPNTIDAIDINKREP